MEINKAYEARQIEQKWYRWWKRRAISSLPNPRQAPLYQFLIPPPNVTGILHIGPLCSTTPFRMWQSAISA